MNLFFEPTDAAGALSREQVQKDFYTALDALGPRRKVLVLPPDFTRFHSGAGQLTRLAWQYYGDRLSHVMPATGTHVPMSREQINRMFGDMPEKLFHSHDWRNSCVTLGRVPADFIHDRSEGRVCFDWPAQVNRLLLEGDFDLILSIGQVVPHEVIGMANHNKNVFIGVGGAEAINRSHYLGAVYGMERIMGRADTPVRQVLNYASEHFARDLPIVYALTVISVDQKRQLATRGLFVGDDLECFERASALSKKVNVTVLERQIQKAVVYLHPDEYHSAWVGNKAIYRTRMAIADGGEVVILAPGVRTFGEDAKIDSLIRQFGYAGTAQTVRSVERDPELAANLSAAAHLIHGSSEGRFTVTYCPGHLTKGEVEGVHFRYLDCETMMRKYDPANLENGYNMVDGEEIFFVSNPSLGLWTSHSRFGMEKPS